MDFQRIFGIGMTLFETNAIELEPAKEEKVMNSHDLTSEQKLLLDSVIQKLPSFRRRSVALYRQNST